MAFLCAACIAAALAHRWHVMARVRLWTMVPVPFYGPFTGDTQARLHVLWSETYLSLASHLPALCMGALAAPGALLAGFHGRPCQVSVPASCRAVSFHHLEDMLCQNIVHRLVI